MKINDAYRDNRASELSQGQIQRASETEALQKAKAAGASASGRAGGSDEVALSNLANSIQEALSDSSARTSQLEKLAAEFSAGKYRPDSAATSNSLVHDALLPDPANHSQEPV